MKIKIPKFLKRKRNIWIIAILIIVIIIGYFIFKPKVNTSIQTGVVTKQNLQQTVLSTGQVVSGTDLTLSFQGSGVVRSISVKEGDKVNQGQVLASLSQSSALATLTSAQGSLAQAQANYNKLINGASQNDIQALQDAVNSAKVNATSAYNNTLSALNNGYTAIFNAEATAKIIQDTYFRSADSSWGPVYENKTNIINKLAIAKDNINQISAVGITDLIISNVSNSLASVLASLQIIRDQTNTDTYISSVSVADKAALDSQKSAVSSALSSVNTLQGSIASYNASLQTAMHNLAAKQSAPRQEDIDLAKAQMLSAQGQFDSAQAVVNNSIVVAPASGIITEVDIKVGEQATATAKAIVLQDINNLHAEANVSEANIASLQVGQSIDYTFDALGPDKHFSGKMLSINPASTVISGVVNYEVKGSIENIPDIKPGMTANMTILAAEKDNALAVSSTAVINKNNKSYVRVVDDPQKLTYHEVEVQTGLQADGGLIEILSGLSEGQKIITYMKQ